MEIKVAQFYSFSLQWRGVQSWGTSRWKRPRALTSNTIARKFVSEPS